MFNWLPRRYYISLIIFFNEWSSRFLSEVCTSFDRRRSKLMYVIKTRSCIFHACIFFAINYYCLTSYKILSFLTAFIYFCQIDDVLLQSKSNLGTNRTQSLRHEVTFCHFFCSVSDRLSWMKTAWNQNYRFLGFSWRTSFILSLNFDTDPYKRFP